jgi:septal ring factor EnvC (AmiA/AmiB activator)
MTPNYGAFKRWFVKRPDGGCQVLLPLSELDTTVDEACTPIRNRLVQMERALADRDRRIDEGDAIPASFYKRLEEAEERANTASHDFAEVSKRLEEAERYLRLIGHGEDWAAIAGEEKA